MIIDNFFFTETLQKAQTAISTFVNSSGTLFDVDLQLIVFLGFDFTTLLLKSIASKWKTPVCITLGCFFPHLDSAVTGMS